MPFKKGNKGKPRGATNIITRTVKEALMIAFNELQQDKMANLLAWGKENPTAFYQVAAKLIPTEIHGTFEVTKIKVSVNKKSA